MLSRLPLFSLWLTAVTYLAFAAWLGTSPAALLGAFQMPAGTAGMLIEIRAFYGGIELGIAATMLLLWHRGDRFAALLAGGLPLAGAASVRIVSMLIDEVSSLHLGIACAEASGGVLCLSSSWLVVRDSSGPVEEIR